MLKVYIRQSDYGFCTDIMFMEEREDGKRYCAKNIQFEFKEYEYGDLPTIQLTHEVAMPFLKAMAEALDKNEIKTENDFKIKGLMEATKYHLEDMRKLVFKEKK